MIQRRATRWVSNQYSSYNSVTAMLSNLGWCSLEYRRYIEYRRYDSRLAIFFFLQNTVWPCCNALILSVLRLGESLATASDNPLGFRQVFARSYHYTGNRCSFYPMTIVLWNRLPAEIVLLPDLDSFKREVSKIDISMP